MKHIILLAFVSFALVACGNKGNGNINPECMSGGVTGAACTLNDDCCTNYCEPLTGTCAREPGTCGAANADCSVGPDCCSFSCIDFKCSGNQCTSDNGSCSNDGQCCSGICTSGTCQPLNPSCKTSGNQCSGHGDCCSKYCNNGLCSISPSYCTQSGDACVLDAECCGGMCNKPDGATLGTCSLVPATGATQCASAGQVCGDGANYAGGALPTCGGECCSRACFPYGPTGVLVCQPPSGCRPTGELCTADEDCCGGPGNPDHSPSNVRCQKVDGNPVGRCDNGNACSPAGAICRLQSESCNANANCCSGNVLQFNSCQQDNLGIPRCAVAACPANDPTCSQCVPSEKVGTACASSADCCGLPCVYVPGSELGYVCGESCVPAGGACTTTADCCSGLPCNIPGGSVTGTCGNTPGCHEYGQDCTDSSQCCNDLTCLEDGKCGAILL
jgi:hypothetical protein